MKSKLLALAAAIEAAAQGVPEWRVAGPDGAYCIAFSRADSLNPEREARRWFDEHKDYCESRGYTVQQATSHTQQDMQNLEVAANLRELAGAAPNRDAFEAFFAHSRGGRGRRGLPTFERLPDDTYRDDSTQRHWWTWQRSFGAHMEQPCT